ncbi:MAG: hydrogenase [Methanocalculaceae archaeon]|jgi:hypothetical protein|nr:hydrogenase [Methanocalculaceae archaeon]
MIGTLATGFGFWNPLMWIIVIVVAIFFSWLLWKLGETNYEGNIWQTAPYLSGNDEPEKEAIHIRAGNMYWGFTKALSVYYDHLIPLHSGIVSDYISWFLIGVVVLFMVVILV